MTDTVYYRRVRPSWVAYCALLTGGGLVAVLVALGLRLPLLVLLVIPIVLIGLAFLLVSALPARKFESTRISTAPTASEPTPHGQVPPSETESCQP